MSTVRAAILHIMVQPLKTEAQHRSPRSLTDLKLNKYVTKKDLMSDSELKFRTTFVTHLLTLKSQSTLRAPPSAPPPVRWVYCIF